MAPRSKKPKPDPDRLIQEEIINVDDLSLEELLHLAWETGDLSSLMHAGQLRLRNHIHAWRAIDQLEEVHETGSIPLVYAVEGSKRFGKTSAMLWVAHEIAIWFAQEFGQPACMRYTSAFSKTIDEIVGSTMPQCFRTAPDSCSPHYHGKRGVRPAGLYWPESGPTLGARLALSGLDRNPDALRGQGNDFDFISEAAFIDQLEYTVRNVLIHQYQGKPHARMVVETSAPKDVDTDWERLILPDAKVRGAHFVATIDDNPRLTQREKDYWINMAGGRDHPDARREYFNVIAGNPALQAIPEFDVTKHVLDFDRPEHCIGLVAADPGMTHLFGLVFAEYDFDRDKLLVLDSWAQSNAGSMKVAAVCAAREFVLWGRWPDTRMKRIPYVADRDGRGWVDLLDGDKHENLAKKLYEMAQTPAEQRPDFERFPGQWIVNEPQGFKTYYDRNGFHVNPAVRVSDVDKQLIRDIDDHYGLVFEPTTKSELITMIRNTRNWVAENRLWFAKDAGPVIDHFRAGKLDRRHRMLDEHKVMGHYDCIGQGTLVSTERGDVPIECVCVGDRVWTREGLKSVSAAWSKGTRPTLLVEFDGGSFEATANHRVWTENRGWVPVASLTSLDTLLTWASSENERLSSSTVANTVDIQTLRPRSTATTTAVAKATGFIETCGYFIADLFLRAWTSITWTRILSTTTSATWPSSTTAITAPTTWVRKSWPNCDRTSKRHRMPPGLGIQVQKDALGTALSEKGRNSRSSSRSTASFAGSTSFLPSRSRSSALTNALGAIERLKAAVLKFASASCAKPSSRQISIAQDEPAPAAVLRITAGRTVPVYDLTVDDAHEFFANGALVHNCLAAGVYLTRRAELIKNQRPHPPAHLNKNFPAGSTVIERLPWVPKSDAERALEEVQKLAHGQANQRGRMRLFSGGRK